MEYIFRTKVKEEAETIMDARLNQVKVLWVEAALNQLKSGEMSFKEFAEDIESTINKKL